MFRISEDLVDIDEIPYHQRRFVKIDSRNGNLSYEYVSRLPDAVRVLGNKCIKCDYDNMKALVIDHINGDGCMERNYLKSKSLYCCIYFAFLYDITEAIEIIKSRYQVLCANCNMIKQRDNRENGDILHQYQFSDAQSIVLRLKSLVFTIGKHKGWRE